MACQQYTHKTTSDVHIDTHNIDISNTDKNTNNQAHAHGSCDISHDSSVVACDCCTESHTSSLISTVLL